MDKLIFRTDGIEDLMVAYRERRKAPPGAEVSAACLPEDEPAEEFHSLEELLQFMGEMEKQLQETRKVRARLENELESMKPGERPEVSVMLVSSARKAEREAEECLQKLKRQADSMKTAAGG